MTKEPLRFPLPPPPELVARPVTPQDIAKLLHEKEKEALQMWALQKMGQDLKKYLEPANRNFC